MKTEDVELFNRLVELQGELISNLTQEVFQRMHTPDDAIIRMLRKSNESLREQITEFKAELVARGVMEED